MMKGNRFVLVGMVGVLTLGLRGGDVATQSGGSVVGTVRFLEMPPEAERITVTTNTDVCGLRKSLREFVVSEETQGLMNVVLSVIGAPDTRALPTTQNPEITQQTCVFQPHVTTGVTGQMLQFKNGWLKKLITGRIAISCLKPRLMPVNSHVCSPRTPSGGTMNSLLD